MYCMYVCMHVYVACAGASDISHAEQEGSRPNHRQEVYRPAHLAHLLSDCQSAVPVRMVISYT